MGDRRGEAAYGKPSQERDGDYANHWATVLPKPPAKSSAAQVDDGTGQFFGAVDDLWVAS